MAIASRSDQTVRYSAPSISEIKSLLHTIAGEYADSLRAVQHADVPRIAFNISLIADRQPRTVCDLGGGIGLFSVGCAALGMDTWVVDDFSDSVNTKLGDSAFTVHRKYGVKVKSANVIQDKLDFVAGQFDAVTCFESMEHWHHSPRRLFRDVMRWLRPGGQFVLSTPNCVNLRKRLTIPLGYGRWTRFEEWYDPDVFRGHVREPSVGDLRTIGADMGLESTRVFGRNWIVPAAVDLPLRLFPSLCADIYLHGLKPIAAPPGAIHG